jgi:hypothetical protein
MRLGHRAGQWYIISGTYWHFAKTDDTDGCFWRRKHRVVLYAKKPWRPPMSSHVSLTHGFCFHLWEWAKYQLYDTHCTALHYAMMWDSHWNIILLVRQRLLCISLLLQQYICNESKSDCNSIDVLSQGFTSSSFGIQKTSSCSMTIILRQLRNALHFHRS